MISLPAARQLALSLPEVEEKSHFEKPDFRIRNKVLAVLHVGKHVMVIKLSLVDQSVFCAFDTTVIYPVPGGWGRQGWTMINLKKVKKAMLVDALTTAWKTVAPATLVKKYFPNA
ncbi:MmcQ/YjbR family DNA-binding protein [Terrimonas pollutisoli]|uniref:MmcQ/YjbR family DNA-binding protein n=1 Tax=Terrimonas pollutisoli TaxID=3034147 RepID=UPI0023EAD960|nr:MmcQ/YjbR family DNA-binding protein [Terrimonas sp. H1YJ31]